MKLIDTIISDVKIIEPDVYGDARGFFLESWNQHSFHDMGLDAKFVQDNHSRSSRGILRGLHYQVKHPQGKLVRVTSGSVFDVAVDIRKTSPTFAQWVGVELSADNHRMMWIPPGFAHGFYVLSPSADFLYKTTDYYMPELERSILWDDEDLAIEWPLVGGKPPLLAEKDQQAKRFRDAGFSE
jgi:dTDP-4-dehydrorhamnose 3,5-epimerase